MRSKRRGGGLVLRALTAFALTVAPYHLSIDGFAATKAFAGKGGNGGGNNGNGSGNGGSNGNGNGAGGDSSGGGNGNNGNGNGDGGSNGNGNNGNGNTGGNSGGDNSNDGTSSSSTTASGSVPGVADHVTVTTGDKVEVSGNKIEVTHRNGMKERVENGRFRMEDKYGRTIVDRKATMADLTRLKNF